MASISPEKARTYGLCTVISAWLAVFCLFGYRSSFSIMQKMIIADTGWTTMQVSLGYCLMMTIYAITAFSAALWWISAAAVRPMRSVR